MTNNVPNETVHNHTFLIRWVAATAVVLTVGLGSFLVRNDDPRRPTKAVAVTTVTAEASSATGEGQTGFPEIPDFEGVALGEETESTSHDSVPAEDFARCDAAPRELKNNAPDDWVTYKGGRGVSFRHPANWDVFEEGEQVAATSPDGSRAFVVDVVASEDLAFSFAKLFTTMATMRPGLEYSDPRSVLVDGKHGCAVKIEGDGHSGRLLVLPFSGGIALMTVGHELDASERAVEEGWAMLASVRIEAAR